MAEGRPRGGLNLHLHGSVEVFRVVGAAAIGDHNLQIHTHDPPHREEFFFHANHVRTRDTVVEPGTCNLQPLFHAEADVLPRLDGLDFLALVERVVGVVERHALRAVLVDGGVNALLAALRVALGDGRLAAPVLLLAGVFGVEHGARAEPVLERHGELLDSRHKEVLQRLARARCALLGPPLPLRGSARRTREIGSGARLFLDGVLF
mmetsp:Transcript_18219/g.37416  ORF Transcript_18219/g.37416 Transcript_18219/m.37416 type:complete len:207 (-) Transcript_18219:795-1415(-)